jgi:hypothetical protein
MAARRPPAIDGDGRRTGPVGTAQAFEDLERYVTRLATPAQRDVARDQGGRPGSRSNSASCIPSFPALGFRTGRVSVSY